MRREFIKILAELSLHRTVAPTVNDDVHEGLAVGQRWLDTTHVQEYVCLSNAAGAAVWLNTHNSGSAQLIETGGPTTLVIGAIGDGKVIKRVGSTAVGGSYDTVTVVRATDLSRTANDTPADDSTLLVAIGASQVWEYELLAWFSSDADVDGLQVGMGAPTGVTSIDYILDFFQNATTASAAGISQHVASTSAVTLTPDVSDVSSVRIRGVVKNGSTAGNLSFQWSQGVSNAGALICQATSLLKARRLS